MKSILGRLVGVILFVAALAEIVNFATSHQTYFQNGLAYGKYLYRQHFSSAEPKKEVEPRKQTAHTPCKSYGFRIVKPDCKSEESRTKRMLCKLKPGKGEIYCKSRGE